MRLIDADILKMDLTRFYDGEVTAKQLIDEQPTIEPKTGHWIPMEVSSGRDSWKCSVCGRRARGKLENLPYCHCGSKMTNAKVKEPQEETSQKNGKWIYDHIDLGLWGKTCSECGKLLKMDSLPEVCPNCGSHNGTDLYFWGLWKIPH